MTLPQITTRVNSTPSRIMCAEPFLQRLNFKRIRPVQNMAIDIPALHSQRTPIPYPIQEVHLMPSSNVTEPDHGVFTEWPWSKSEVEKNSNPVFSKK